jgi:gentisate 1,2-dioxygenase
MIWVDGLDVPIVTYLHVQFFEEWKEARFPSRDFDGPSNFRYPWVEMQARLQHEPGPYARVPYLQRAGGQAVSRTIGAFAERLDAGTKSPVRQSTASHVYVVHSGRGATRIGSSTICWEKGDTFAIPTWQRFEHEALDGPAYLFCMDDRPMIDALGYYQERRPSAFDGAHS